jgi:hypothetical protein
MAKRSGKPFDGAQHSALRIALERAIHDATDGIVPETLLREVQRQDAHPLVVRALRRAFADLSSGALRAATTPSKMVGQIVYTAPTTIDRRLTIEQMAVAAGWGPRNPAINSVNFQHEEGRPLIESLSIHLIYYPSQIDTPEIVRDMAVGGIVPTTIDAFLAFGNEFARITGNNHMVGLGSWLEIDGARQYPTYDNGYPRAIDLEGWRHEWHPVHLFGGVKVADLQKNVI